MITTDEKVYRCDHCNRAIVSKGSMVLHERMCRKNPNNQHQCFKYCKWLFKYTQTASYDEEETPIGVVFECTHPESKLGELYSYKLERFKINIKKIRGLTRMPLVCTLYECENGHDFGKEETK